MVLILAHVTKGSDASSKIDNERPMHGDVEDMIVYRTSFSSDAKPNSVPTGPQEQEVEAAEQPESDSLPEIFKDPIDYSPKFFF